MTKRSIWLPLCLTLALLGVAAGQYSIGQEVADFSASTASGASQRLSDQQGKVVVLVLWSSNCRGSKGYVERLEAIRRQFASQGVVFWAVASNSTETAAGVQAAKSEQGFTWPVLLDGDKAIAKAFNQPGFFGVTPSCFVIDGQRRLRYQGQIDDDPRGNKPDRQNYLKDAIQAVLSGGSPPAPTTPRGTKIQ